MKLTIRPSFVRSYRGSFFFAIATFGTWLKENRRYVQEVTGVGSERGMSSSTMPSDRDSSRVFASGISMYDTARNY